VAAGQRHPIKDRYPIDNSNHLTFYQKAQKLIELNNPDSSFEATRILWALLYYDTTKYSVDLFTPLLDKIENANRAFYKTTLSGQWKFEWSGSNWGTAQTSKDVNKSIVFTDKEAIFYSGDTIKRRTVYYLSNNYPLYFIPSNNSQSRFTTVNLFHLVFADTKEEWNIRFYKDGFVPYVGQTQTTAMLINQMPNCVCGCPEEVYNKVVDNSLVGRQ
jgi:hypothetical protein